MVVLIAGASHTGKTALAQSLLEQKGYPYLSIDLLKMGLIRTDRIWWWKAAIFHLTGNAALTPCI